MNKLVYTVILLFILAVSVGAAIWLNSNSKPVEAIIPNGAASKYDVRLLIHLNDDLEPSVIKSMLARLPVVTGLQLSVWVGDNTTGGIYDATARISKWLHELRDYSIVIQCDYAFESKYGYWEKPFWKYNTTQTLSQEWYNRWYGNLSLILNQFPNVILMVGLNEPYNHFQTKELAQTIIEREYLTWKNISNIPFTVKFSMPYIMWANVWSFPENPSVEDDLVPYWTNYSDYVGMDLWADGVPPQYAGNVEAMAFSWVKDTISMAENYSAALKKPIFIGEYPAWYPHTLQYISDHVAKLPNIGQVYQLWYWKGQEELHQDAWTYGLFNVDAKTHEVTTAEPTWSVFNKVFNSPSG